MGFFAHDVGIIISTQSVVIRNTKGEDMILFMTLHVVLRNIKGEDMLLFMTLLFKPGLLWFAVVVLGDCFVDDVGITVRVLWFAVVVLGDGFVADVGI
eukprot:1349507-Amorphochlora_amoeboformis.AAC.1